MAKFTAEEIKRLFNGRLIGSIELRRRIIDVVFHLPVHFIKHITQKVWFISSPEDAWALTMRGSDVHGQHIIVLSHELLKEDDQKIKYVILHEIGHVVLNHRNSMGFRQTDKEINRQEQEADKFAKKYLLS